MMSNRAKYAVELAGLHHILLGDYMQPADIIDRLFVRTLVASLDMSDKALVSCTPDFPEGGDSAPFICDDEQAEYLIYLARRKWSEWHKLRIFRRKSRGGWKSIGLPNEMKMSDRKDVRQLEPARQPRKVVQHKLME